MTLSRFHRAYPGKLKIVGLLAGLWSIFVPADQLHGQGLIIFNNRVNGVVVAPVHGVEPSNPALQRQGNAVDGYPAGTQNYGGLRLSGPAWTAQLFGGSTRAALANLQPLFPPTSFRSNESAGFVAPPSGAVIVPGVAEGESGLILLRAWENRGGSISNWQQAAADPTIARGESRPFITPPLGGPFFSPPNLAGLESFNVATGAILSAGVKINFQRGAAPVPAGYLVDDGSAFGARPNGLSYGWNDDLRKATQGRSSANSSDALHDTFTEMRGSNAVWELAVTNGVYMVHVAAGDPDNALGIYRITAQGTEIASGTPTSAHPWVEGDGVVEVTNGRLTIASGPGAVSNKLCFVEVLQTGPVTVALGAAAATPVIRYGGTERSRLELQASMDFSSWTALTNEQQQGISPLSFADFAAAAIPFRFYRARTLATGHPTLVYTNDFSAAAGGEWSMASLGITPSGRPFNGPFGSNAVLLVLTNLPRHTRIVMLCDLFIIGSWEGNDTVSGPDRWQLTGNGKTLLQTTFGTGPTSSQAYPGNASLSFFPPRSGAVENDTLGYGSDCVYRLSYTIKSTSDSVVFTFKGGTTEIVAEESWGLSNLSVQVLDDPYD